MLAAVVAAFFYLRVVVTMYTGGEAADAPRPSRRIDPPSAVVLAVTAAITLVIGILPGTFLHLAKDATFLVR